MHEIRETIEGVNLLRLYRLTIGAPEASGCMRVGFIEADNAAQAREIVTRPRSTRWMGAPIAAPSAALK